MPSPRTSIGVSVNDAEARHSDVHPGREHVTDQGVGQEVPVGQHHHAGGEPWRRGQPPAEILADHRLWARHHGPDEDGDPLDEWQAGYGRLRRWAHMLGFGGHFSTKSRRYSTTLGALRQARRDWRREHLHDTGPDRDEHDQALDDDAETTVVIASLAFAGIGWHTTADALLAKHRARQRPRATTHRARGVHHPLPHLKGAEMERLLLTAEEVAESIHIGRTRVYALIAAKEITSVKIGGLRRIPVDAVREYAARLVQLEREAS